MNHRKMLDAKREANAKREQQRIKEWAAFQQWIREEAAAYARFKEVEERHWRGSRETTEAYNEWREIRERMPSLPKGERP
jgi:hypothetical protein